MLTLWAISGWWPGTWTDISHTDWQTRDWDRYFTHRLANMAQPKVRSIEAIHLDRALRCLTWFYLIRNLPVRTVFTFRLTRHNSIYHGVHNTIVYKNNKKPHTLTNKKQQTISIDFSRYTINKKKTQTNKIIIYLHSDKHFCSWNTQKQYRTIL